jgi:hypothetical protein
MIGTKGTFDNLERVFDNKYDFLTSTRNISLIEHLPEIDFHYLSARLKQPSSHSLPAAQRNPIRLLGISG